VPFPLETPRAVPFADRFDAGVKLAGALAGKAAQRTLLLGLYRGGVAVAAAAAARLGLPFAPLAVRKVGHPDNPELAIGAVAPRSVAVLDATAPLLEAGVLAAALERARLELAESAAGLPPLDLVGRPCVVVDDGLATGLTALAACRAALELGATAAAVATPVASEAALERLAAEGFTATALVIARRLVAVSRWYRRFDPPDPGQLRALLQFRPAVRRELLALAGRLCRLELPAGFWQAGAVAVVGPPQDLADPGRALCRERVGFLAVPWRGREDPQVAVAAIEALRALPETALLPLALWGVGEGSRPVATATWALGRGVVCAALAEQAATSADPQTAVLPYDRAQDPARTAAALRRQLESGSPRRG